MVMDFWHSCDAANLTVSLDELLQAGLAHNAYIPDVGWSHAGLVGVAACYGYGGYNRDWAPNGPTPKYNADAWKLLRDELDRGPVLVSVCSRFDPANLGGHIVVVTGWDGALVALNDPVALDAREGKKLMALQTFLPAFKQRYIVIRPSVSL